MGSTRWYEVKLKGYIGNKKVKATTLVQAWSSSSAIAKTIKKVLELKAERWNDVRLPTDCLTIEIRRAYKCRIKQAQEKKDAIILPILPQ